MEKLSTGEWRLLLLSDCIKYFKGVHAYTSLLSKEGKDAILAIDQKDTNELNNFVNNDDIIKIRAMLHKEWRFTGKVVDNGAGVKTTCEYCQKQQIRYKYLCRNDKTNTWLALGSVCVGHVIHGESLMKNKEFANKFVEELDRLKGNSTKADSVETSYEDIRERRAEQVNELRIMVQYLRSKGHGSSPFLKSMEQRWHNGKALTDNQMEALRNMCKKIKYGSADNGLLVFKDLDAEIQYQKVILKLNEHPDNEFLKSCKLRIERYGELTSNMSRALMGGA